MGFLSKIFKSKIFKAVAPIALSLIPGIGPVAAGLAGAGIGAVGGGGLKGALMGGLGGYAGAGGFSGALGSAAGSTIPLTSNGIAGGIGQIASKGSGLLGGLGSVGSGLSSVLGAAGGGGSNLLSTAANIYSGVAGNSAVKDQTKAMTSANNKALALQSKMYDQTTANMSPFLTAGQSANSRLSALLGLDGQDPATMQAELENSPGYQFRLQQGTKSMNQSLGARGALFSGDALKAAQTFGQGLADQTYNDRLTQLANASASGQSAAANQGASNQSYANQGGSLLSNQGNIYASGSQASQNAINQSLANVFGSPVGGFSGTGTGTATNKVLYDPYTGKRIA